MKRIFVRILLCVTVFISFSVGAENIKRYAGFYENAAYQPRPHFNGESGQALDIRLDRPMGGAIYNNEFYFADSGNGRIRKINNTQFLQTVVGGGQPPNDLLGFSGDGGPALHAQLNRPSALTFDSVGNMYIADTLNNRIRKVTNGVIETIAGDGTTTPKQWFHTTSMMGDLAIDEPIDQPTDVKWINNELWIITKQGLFYINQDGYLIAIIKHFSSLGKGGIAVDHLNNVYVTIDTPPSYSYPNQLIRVFPDKTYVVVQEEIQGGLPQNQLPLSTNFILSGTTVKKISFDRWGSMFFTNHRNHQVYKVSAHNTLRNVAGTHNSAGNYVLLAYPDAVTPSQDGNKVFITDTGHGNIYVVDNFNEGAMPTVYGGTDVDGSCGLDATTDGEILSCNPVNLATGTKIDYAEDFRNNSAFPIVWSRYYHSKKGDWTFSYERSVVELNTPQGKTLQINRPDGVVLRFRKKSGVWVLDMGPNKSVVNIPQEIMSGNVSYTYTNLNDEKEIYDLDGKLQSIVSKEGWTLTMIYDGANRLSRVNDNFGRHLNLSYHTPVLGGESYLTSVTDGEQTIDYDYIIVNGKPLLNAVEKNGGQIVQYEYDEPNNPTMKKGRGLLTKIIDENGDTFAHYTYDEFGRAVQTVHDPDGLAVNTNEFEYFDDYGETHFTQNGKNNIAFVGKKWYSQGTSKPRNIQLPCSTCTGSSYRRSNYDEYGNPVLQYDFNNVQTANTYDTQRALVTQQIKAYGTANAQQTDIQWHSQFRVPTNVEEQVLINNQLVTRTTTLQYNSNGQVTSATVSVPTETPRTVTTSYTSQKLPHTVTDAMGRTTTYSYDTQGNVIGITNNLGQTTQFGNYTLSGKPRLVTHPNGLQKKFTLDANQNITKIEEGTVSAGWRTTTLEYDLRGSLLKTQFPDGNYLQYTYDTAKRVTSLSDRNGTTVFEYDQYSKLIKETTTTVHSNTPLAKETNYQYNAYDYISEITSPESSVFMSPTSVEYRATDREGNILYSFNNSSQNTYSYDEFNRVVSKTTEAGYGLDTLPQNTTQWSYNTNGVNTATDERLVSTTYTYNAFDEIISVDSPDAGTQTFSRNANGEITQRTDARGVVVTYTRDGLGRVVSQTLSDAQVPSTNQGFLTGSQNQSFVYDSCTNGIGLLCSAHNYSGTTTYSYNVWKQPTQKVFSPANTSLNLTVAYEYDTIGNMTKVFYPSNRRLDVSYSFGLPSDISFDAQPILNNAKHYPFGLGYASYEQIGGDTQRVLDPSGQTKHIYAPNYYNKSLYGWHQWYGVNEQTDTDPILPSQLSFFQHNSKSNLIMADLSNYPDTLTYSYDVAGNRVQRVADTTTIGTFDYSYSATNNRLLAIEQNGSVIDSYTYDSAGNTISGNGWTYLYDAENRMRQAHNGISASFEYNPLGQRVKKNGLNGTEYFVYDEVGRLLGVYDGAGQPKEEIVWFDGWKAVATVRGQGISSQTYFIDSDHLNAPIVVRDALGKTIWTWDNREPFGLQRPNEDPDGDMQYFYLNLRFPGQWFDNETGLFHNGFRDYNPSLGRYMQSDPLGLEAGFNTYSYVNGNPYRSLDPYGLIEYEEVGKRKSGELCTGLFCSKGYFVDIQTPRGGQAEAFFSNVSEWGLHKQNCHGYALNIQAWINNPNDIYQKETMQVDSAENADIFYDTFLGQPWHSGKISAKTIGKTTFIGVSEKSGIAPVTYTPAVIEPTILQRSYLKFK